MTLALRDALILIFLTISFTGSVFDEIYAAPPEDGKYNLRMVDQKRPAPPYPGLPRYTPYLQRHGSGGEFTVPVSRHHIIPLNVLMEFYNKIISRGDILRIAGFFNRFGPNIRNFAHASAISCAGSAAAADIADAWGLSTGLGRGRIISGGDNRPDGFDTFAQFYAWMPGNLFIGPTNRVDDPGDQFETGAQYIIDADRFAILQRLNGNIITYNNGLDVLRDIILDLMALAQRQQVTDLNPYHWERATDDPVTHTPRYRIKRINRVERDAQDANQSDFIQNSDPSAAGDCANIKPPRGYDTLPAIRQIILAP